VSSQVACQLLAQFFAHVVDRRSVRVPPRFQHRQPRLNHGEPLVDHRGDALETARRLQQLLVGLAFTRLQVSSAVMSLN
jgi:hypothetical protein